MLSLTFRSVVSRTGKGFKKFSFNTIILFRISSFQVKHSRDVFSNGIDGRARSSYITLSLLKNDYLDDTC